MSYLGDDQVEVERAAQAFVKDYMHGQGKDRAMAKKILLDQVSKRHDSRSKAIRRILEARS